MLPDKSAVPIARFTESRHDPRIAPWGHEPHALMNSGRNMKGIKALDFMFRPEFMRRFLASDGARHITGADLPVDDGFAVR